MRCFNLITPCRVSIRKHGIWKKWTHPNSQLQRPGNFIQLRCACSWKKNQWLDPSASMFFRYEMQCRGPPVSCAVLTAKPGQSYLGTSEIFIFPCNPQVWPMVLLEKYQLCFGNVHSLHMLMSYRVLSLSPFPPPNFPTLCLWPLFIWLSAYERTYGIQLFLGLISFTTTSFSSDPIYLQTNGFYYLFCSSVISTYLYFYVVHFLPPLTVAGPLG